MGWGGTLRGWDALRGGFLVGRVLRWAGYGAAGGVGRQCSPGNGCCMGRGRAECTGCEGRWCWLNGVGGRCTSMPLFGTSPNLDPPASPPGVRSACARWHRGTPSSLSPPDTGAAGWPSSVAAGRAAGGPYGASPGAPSCPPPRYGPAAHPGSPHRRAAGPRPRRLVPRWGREGGVWGGRGGCVPSEGLSGGCPGGLWVPAGGLGMHWGLLGPWKGLLGTGGGSECPSGGSGGSGVGFGCPWGGSRCPVGV